MGFKDRKIDGLTEDEFDKLTLVLGLVNHGWSYRKIGRILMHSDMTIKSMYGKALQLKDDGKLCKTAKSERVVKIVYVGGSNDLDYIAGHESYSDAGGGRRVRPVRYNDNYEIES